MVLDKLKIAGSWETSSTEELAVDGQIVSAAVEFRDGYSVQSV
jgi:hypothetical protein